MTKLEKMVLKRKAKQVLHIGGVLAVAFGAGFLVGVMVTVKASAPRAQVKV